MLDSIELRLLSQWCRTRRMQWQPGLADDGSPALLLLGASRFGGQYHGMAYHCLMLLPDDSEWRLLDGPGQVLAAASGLSELLDALDAGVGEAAAPERGMIGDAEIGHWNIGAGNIGVGNTGAGQAARGGRLLERAG